MAGVVALVKKKINRLVDCLQPLWNFAGLSDLYKGSRFTKELAGPAQPLLIDSSPAKRALAISATLKPQRVLRMSVTWISVRAQAASKDHAKLVVLNLFFECGLSLGACFPQFQKICEFRSEVAELIVAAYQVDSPVTGRLHEPRGRILGKAVRRPGLQGLAKGVLD